MNKSSIGFFILMAVIWTGLTAIAMVGLPKQDSSFTADEFGLVLSVVLLLGVQLFYWIILGLAYFANYLGKRFDSARATLIFVGVTSVGGVLALFFVTEGRAMSSDASLTSMMLPLALIGLAYAMRIFLAPSYEL